MQEQKEHILMLVQAGYSAKNFILSGFLENEKADITFWSDQDYISQYKITNALVKLPKYEYSGKVNFIQKIKNKAETFFNIKTFKDKNYKLYLIGIKKTTSIKLILKDRLSTFIAHFFANKKGIEWLDKPFYNQIRKTNYYQKCKQQLIENKPKIVFCTHQRASNAVAPMLAARDLKIRTVCFIHSWDNMPKGVQLVKADEYFVWSDYMKQEMLDYYPFIAENSIKVTGTPQFITHFKEEYKLDRATFLSQFNLDIEKKYILFSGNDRTTSPNDPVYLNDVCEAVKKLNLEEDLYRVLFRPNPIDRNEGFDEVLKNQIEVVTELKPKWFGSDVFLWNKGGPNKKDISLLVNTISHSELIVNMGSSMVIDAALLGKPACYINYDVPSKFNWSVKRTYKFIHFKIIKDINPIGWIHNRDEIVSILKDILENPHTTKKDRAVWINRVTKLPIENTIHRMWNHLITNNEV